MQTNPHAGWKPRASNSQILVLVLAFVLALVGVGRIVAARDSPESTPTPNWVTAPSLPVRGPIISSTPIRPGAMVPTPGMISPPVHPIQITIDNYVFSMRPGPCASRVRAAIDGDENLFTGDKACDSLIRQARAIQRQKEAEDPAYARALHAAPVPTRDPSIDDETH